MKINKLFTFLLVITASVFVSCERELETEGISRITNYAVFNMQGEQWISIPVGGSFTDPGVTATEAGQQIEVTITGDQVDTNTPGVYTIVYTATNKDRYSATTRRYIGVISPDAAAADLTGSYRRNAGQAGVSNVTKVKDGLYRASNVAGTVPSDATPVYFYHIGGDQLRVPVQVVESGATFYCTNATIQIGVSYSWVVINSAFLNNLRTFVKI